MVGLNSTEARGELTGGTSPHAEPNHVKVVGGHDARAVFRGPARRHQAGHAHASPTGGEESRTEILTMPSSRSFSRSTPGTSGLVDSMRGSRGT